MITLTLYQDENEFTVEYEPEDQFIAECYVTSDRTHVPAPIDIDRLFVSTGLEIVTLRTALTEKAAVAYQEERIEAAVRRVESQLEGRV